MHATGKHLVHVREQPHIIRIISTQIGQSVGEALGASEQLLVVGKAAAQRMAADIDDFSVGQRQLGSNL